MHVNKSSLQAINLLEDSSLILLAEALRFVLLLEVLDLLLDIFVIPKVRWDSLGQIGALLFQNSHSLLISLQPIDECPLLDTQLLDLVDTGGDLRAEALASSGATTVKDGTLLVPVGTDLNQSLLCSLLQITHFLVKFIAVRLSDDLFLCRELGKFSVSCDRAVDFNFFSTKAFLTVFPTILPAVRIERDVAAITTTASATSVGASFATLTTILAIAASSSSLRPAFLSWAATASLSLSP